MKNIVNNYSSIEQLTNQYLNKQKSTDKKINGISFEEILIFPTTRACVFKRG